MTSGNLVQRILSSLPPNLARLRLKYEPALQQLEADLSDKTSPAYQYFLTHTTMVEVRGGEYELRALNESGAVVVKGPFCAPSTESVDYICKYLAFHALRRPEIAHLPFNPENVSFEGSGFDDLQRLADLVVLALGKTVVSAEGTTRLTGQPAGEVPRDWALPASSPKPEAAPTTPMAIETKSPTYQSWLDAVRDRYRSTTQRHLDIARDKARLTEGSKPHSIPRLHVLAHLEDKLANRNFIEQPRATELLARIYPDVASILAGHDAFGNLRLRLMELHPDKPNGHIWAYNAENPADLDVLAEVIHQMGAGKRVDDDRITRDDHTSTLENARDSGAPDPRPAPVLGPLDTAESRRAAVDAYIQEVFDATQERITRKDIWASARYKWRTELERWERCDPRKPNKSAHERFVRILTEKPHLK